MKRHNRKLAKGGRSRVSTYSTALLAAFATLMVASEAHAYIGPGAGIAAIGSLLAVIGAVFFAIVGFLWYPIKRLRQRGKRTPQTEAQAEAKET